MPLSISQNLAEYRYGDPNPPVPEFTASGNTGDVHWSTSSGTMNIATGLSSALSPENQTEIVTITAQDNVSSTTATIQIWATLPVQPKWGVEADFDPPLATWPMAYEKRDFDEYWNLLQFFKWHRKAAVDMSEAEDGTMRFRIVKGKAFYVEDIATGLLAKVFFDSVFRPGPKSLTWVDYSFVLKAFEFVIPEFPQVGPFVPEIVIPPGPGALFLEDGTELLAESDEEITLEA